MKDTLIEIKQDRPGFNPFMGSWLCRDGLNLLIDVGPAKTSHRLIDSLRALGLERVDYVLLTHIHIDHAGAVADVLEHYPMAKVICHGAGLENLSDPSKLWSGSRKVLGEVAEAYGAPKPVSREKIIPHTESRVDGLRVIETPGHAPHHLSFTYKKHLFAGEAGGNYLVIDGKEYLRPATPPRFFLDVFLKSVDRMLELEDQPIHYAHFGKAESSHRLLKRFREQLMLWKEIIYEEFLTGPQDLVKRCVSRLLSQDRNLEAFERMDPDTQERERVFMANAVKGFTGFFEETSRPA